jgi:DegV family protein with EDD domain
MSQARDRDVVLAMARGAQAAVERSRDRLNDLNVYPVPDGDTGSNLSATARELVTALEADPADGRERLAACATRAALMGATGNSGAILSQIVRGLATLGGADRVDAGSLARALRAASDAAYRPVQQPIEGTMLTVIRVMAEESERAAQGGLELDAALDRVLAAGAAAVEQTRDMLDVLHDAGVVDAGAAGLVELARGAVAGLRGEAVEAPQAAIARPLSLDAVHREESLYRYCTAFLVSGEEVDGDDLHRRLEPLGDCLLVVGEVPLYKVHVHTDDPGAALSAATAMGGIDRVVIADMHAQSRERTDRLAEATRLTVIEGGRDDAAGPELVLTAENTALVLDSTAGVTDPRGEHENWRSVPLVVRFGDESFRDGVDIDAGEFYRRLREGSHHPSTAAPAIGAWLSAFDELEAYARVLVLPVSSAVSASARAATMAAAEAPGPAGRVTVLDGLSVACGTALLADGVQRLLERGTTMDEVRTWFHAARAREEFLISVDTLEYLRRGGRIGRVTATMGGLLDIRPLLTLTNGEVAAVGRVRRSAVFPAFERFAVSRIPEHGPARVGIAHADAPERAERLAEMVARVRPRASVDRVGEIGAVVGAHGGPGTFGLVVLPGE